MHLHRERTEHTAVCHPLMRWLRTAVLAMAACLASSCEKTQPVTMSDSARASRKGLAVCIGATDLSSGYYQSTDGKSLPRLPGAKSDAESMAAICRGEGMTAKTLTGKQARRGDALAAIDEAKRQLVGGDMFVLYFSGHGSQRADGYDDGDDTDDLLDEVWCLYDGQITDDTIRETLKDFAPNVRVVVISDSCHGGTMTEAINAVKAALGRQDAALTPQMLADERVLKALREADLKFFGSAPQDTTKDLPKALPPSVTLATSVKHADLLAARPAAATQSKAKVQSLGASQDKQVAFESNGEGVYTRALKRVWSDGAFSRHYAVFHQEIHKLVSHKQTPRHVPSGSEFDGERPFSVDGREGK